MAGMLFVVCVPSATYEWELVNGSPPPTSLTRNGPPISLDASGIIPGAVPVRRAVAQTVPDHIPMERVLEELLKKLEIEHVVWCADKSTKYYQVFFPIPSGDATENCLHSLQELKIGQKHNSLVSTVPCNVFLQGMDGLNEEEEVNEADKRAWDSFVDSVRAKLTVKQVVDGVRNGAIVSFDYILLILTADMVAAVGLVESSAVNIVAAMLISPLMGPVMALTFGTAIADRNLQWVGVKGVVWGGFISLAFGFIFGLLLGTTEMPWGYGNWPSDEMLSRGNYRSLWIGILWALPSGTGVALALLQGSAGPLIGVAISASLLPPLVNCGILWGLTLTKIGYGDRMKLPHIVGEAYTGPTAYKPVYSDYLPYELVTLGIISFCLTLVNIGCIFIAAIIVLKIKEVAAPYTSSPDVRRFWEHDIPLARDTNRMSTRRSRDQRVMMPHGHGYGGGVEYSSIPQEEMETLEVAVREAMDDDVFRKVKRCSYAHTATDIASSLGLHNGPSHTGRTSRPGSIYGQPKGSDETTVLDPAVLDQLITSLLGVQAAQQASAGGASMPASVQVAAGLSRFRPLSRSHRFGGSTRSRAGSVRRGGGGTGAAGASSGGAGSAATGANMRAPDNHDVGNTHIMGVSALPMRSPEGAWQEQSTNKINMTASQRNESTVGVTSATVFLLTASSMSPRGEEGGAVNADRGNSPPASSQQHPLPVAASSHQNSSAGLPTIEEGASPRPRSRPMSLTERALNSASVRAVVQAVASAPQRLGVANPGEDPLKKTRWSRRGSDSDSLM